MGDPAAQMSETSIGADKQLQDMYFRPLLKSKVAKNTSEATIDDIIESVKLIASSAESVKLQDSEDMTFSLEIFGNLSAIERDILACKMVSYQSRKGLGIWGLLRLQTWLNLVIKISKWAMSSHKWQDIQVINYGWN